MTPKVEQVAPKQGRRRIVLRPAAPTRSSVVASLLGRLVVHLFTGTSRPVRVVVSFCLVLGAFWAYKTVAVPLIEPSIELHGGEPVTVDMVERARNAARARLAKVEGFFEPGRWERDNPMILESDRAKLLLKEYHVLKKGDEDVAKLIAQSTAEQKIVIPEHTLKLVPCTILFYPKETSRTEGGEPNVIILQADSALVHFDRPVDLGKGDIGKITGGRIDGPVLIRGASGAAGQQDDLLVTTRDVQITEDRIFTPHEVQFRVGRNHGQGQELQIGLTASNQKTGSSGPEIGGVEYLELVRNVHMQIQPSDQGILPGDRKAKRGPFAPGLNSSAPVDVTCQGPFRFDVTRNVATFHDRVNVLRNNPGAPVDQLNCQQLSIYFERAANRDNGAAVAGVPDSSDVAGLEPRRLEALGNPVTIRAPSTKSEARGRRLDYDIPSRQIIIEGDDGVILKQDFSEIQSRRIEYTPAAVEGSVGQLNATGPGWFRGNLDGTPLKAEWQTQLAVQPTDGSKVLSLTGGSHLNSAPTGDLWANDIHLWFSDMPEAAGVVPQQDAKTPLRGVTPERMKATGQVQFDSPQLSGHTEELALWFTPRLASSGQVSPALGSAANQTTIENMPGSQPNGQQDSVRKFDMNGAVVHVQLGLVAERPQVEHATVKGAASLKEIASANPNDAPMTITGDELQLTNAHSPTGTVAVVGAPAEVEAGGMKMVGTNIQLNRAQNRLWIDGVGKMLLPIDRDFEGRQLPQPQLIEVAWRGGMDFDGLTATYRDQVIVESQEQTIRTEELKVTLRKRINFSDMQKVDSSRTEVEQVACLGAFSMETRTFQDNRLRASEHLASSDLVVNQTTGVISASGPGRVISRRIGAPSTLTAAPMSAPPPADQLNFTQIDFQNGMTGNVHQRQMTFHRQVRTVHGPILKWDDTIDAELHGPRKDELLMKCDQLTVSQIRRGPQQTSTEMSALGNAKVETDTFDASANRISFSEEKKQIVMDTASELGHRGLVQLRSRLASTKGDISATKVTYWTDTKQVEVNSLGSVNLGQAGGEAGAQRR